jgi:hypothetical protein
VRELIAAARELQSDAKLSDLRYETEEINVIGRGALFVAELSLVHVDPGRQHYNISNNRPQNIKYFNMAD